MFDPSRLWLLICLVCLAGVAGATRADPVSDRIYPAPREALSLAVLPEGARLVTVETADGLALEGVAVPAREGLPTLLFFHGNASSAADAVRWMTPAIGLGYGIVAAEYRGYSGNPGRPSARGLAADADAFLALARESGGPVWIVGHSLGGGVALDLASRESAAAVVTIGTFTRLREMTAGLARAVVPDDYRNRDIVARLTLPYFLVHGTEDEVVPVGHGQALHAVAGAAQRAGASFVLVGADHRPDGEAIAGVLEAIRSGDLPAAARALPDTTKVIPFGVGAPLNP